MKGSTTAIEAVWVRGYSGDPVPRCQSSSRQNMQPLAYAYFRTGSTSICRRNRPALVRYTEARNGIELITR
jgi:hypothetical protein